MATDITTLAIEIQSQEAERNLKTFNGLLSLSSQTANKMEKVSIEVDVEAALAQINALKAGYDNLAASAQNGHFDTGAAPAVSAPAVDAESLAALKEFFASSAEMSKNFREEMAQFNEEIQKLEADTLKAASAGGRSNSSMRGGATASREYAAALKELLAAQKEMERAAARADEDMKATVAADEDAAAVKKKLAAAQRELKSVSAALNDTHRGMGGDLIGLSEKEEYLQNRIIELKSVYEEARAAAEKFNSKLEDSAAKADVASAKYKEIKAKLDAMPKDPMGGAAQSTATFADKARLCGGQLTKLARGFNSVAMMAGGAIPGISGLGRAISMFGIINPYVAAGAAAVGGAVAVYHEYNEVMQDTAAAAREMAAEQAKAAESFKKDAQERNSGLERLAVLNSHETLYDSEKEESRKIVEKLAAAYKGLGIQYDALSGKVLNLADVTKQMSEQDRKRLLEEQQNAVELAKSAAETQLAESQRNSVGWFRNLTTGFAGMDLPEIGMRSAKGFADSWYSYINSSQDLNEQIKRVNEAILNLDKIRQQGGFSAWANDAKKFSEQLQISKKALLEYQKQYEIQKQIQNADIGGRSDKEISSSLRAREAKLKAAQEALRTPEEKYSGNVAAIEKLIAQKEELAALDGKSQTAFKGKNITVAEALLEVETEIAVRTRERLAYEKQIEALNSKIETSKRSWNMDTEGNILSRKSDSEKSSARNSEIETLQNKIQELKARSAGSSPAQAALLKKEIAETQLKLHAVQQERIAGTEAADAAKLRAEEAKRGYVFDRDFRIVREHSEAEKAALLKAEIDAMRDKVAKLAQDTKERANAEEEIIKLTIQERNLKKSALEKQQREQQNLADAQKRESDSRKGYVWNDQGKIVREKNEAELQKEREAELAAAREKVDAAKAGTKEYAEARAELNRLEIADFNARKTTEGGNGTAGMMQEELKVHSNMVKGVNVRSTEARTLEARNFTRGSDPERKVETSLKEIEKVNREIRDFIQSCKSLLDAIQADSSNISGNIIPL